MVKVLTRAGKTTGRYLVLATLTATLAACGGGSGDTVPLAEQDFDGDDIPNGEDDDADGDGTLDAFDTFVDLDGDGFDDTTGAEEEIPVVFTPVSSDNPCGSEGGTDSTSATPAWNDNCWVRIDNGEGEGQFANSLYTVMAVQRIAYCADSTNAGGDAYTAFADGIFGRNTEAAVVAFQTSEPGPQVGDGEIGPNGWAKLQSAISRLAVGQQEPGAASPDVLDVYGFSEGPCANTPLFYQRMVFDSAAGNFNAGGWLLARNAPNAGETAPFTIDPVNGQL